MALAFRFLFFGFFWRVYLFSKKIFILYWSIVNLQCCVSCRCPAKRFSYTWPWHFRMIMWWEQCHSFIPEDLLGPYPKFSSGFQRHRWTRPFPASRSSRLTGESLGNTCRMVSSAHHVRFQLQLCQDLGEFPEDAPSSLWTFYDGSGLGQKFSLFWAEESFDSGKILCGRWGYKEDEKEAGGDGRQALPAYSVPDLPPPLPLPLKNSETGEQRALQHYWWFWGHATEAGLSWTI